MRFKSRNGFLLFSAAILIVGAGICLFVLDRNPVHLSWLDDTDPEAPSTDAFRDNDASVLLVSSLEELATAARLQVFDQMDWSLAWINLLEQEVGYFAHIEVEALAADPWADRSLVILAHSAVSRFSQPRMTFRMASLEKFVASGGALILDRPGKTWAHLSGVRPGKDLPLQKGCITEAAAAVLAPRILEELGRAPLPYPVQMYELAGPLEPDTRTLLALNNAPAIVARRLGKGVVISTTFDLGRLLVVLQQGIPGTDYRVQKRWGFYKHVLETHDLVWDEAYLRSTIPAADILERAVLASVRCHRPLPVWWAFPDEAMGLLLMTHDEDEYGSSQCQLLLDHEKAIGAESTYFLMTGRRAADGWPPEAVQRFSREGADLALHWNRLPAVTGLWKAEPFSRVFSLADQIESYRKVLGDGGIGPAPLLNRNHYLMWASPADFHSGRTHYTRTFRIMHRHGIVMDSSYGPNREGRGYLFGTGRPFYPMDVDGKRIPVHEMPFVSQENWGGENEAWFQKLFSESRDLYHSALCCIFHPHIIVREEEGNRLWKSVYRMAARHGHSALTFRDYYNFLEARRSSPMRSTPLPGGGIRIEATARTDGLSVAVQRDASRNAELDGTPVKRTISLSLDGQPLTLIPVPRGRHTLLLRP